MSDTPRTDAVVNYDTEATLIAQLARQLERELRAALQCDGEKNAPEPGTIEADIVAYKAMKPEDKKLVQTMMNAIIGLRCPQCGNPVPVSFEI